MSRHLSADRTGHLTHTMRKQTQLRIILVVVSVGLTLLVLELAVRTRRGTLLQFHSVHIQPQNPVGRMEYHPRLGWIPRTGRFGSSWISNVDASNIRSNGRLLPVEGRSILTVGDSFTFGDEVEDSETWPAQMEGILNKRVLNAGVGAYGIDQSFLRAELLLDEFKPDVVILSIISDDINRTEFSHYPYGRGWKPYFEYVDGSLGLRNVPVSQTPAPLGTRRFQALRSALGYSSLADAVFNRVAPEWWQMQPVIEQVHHDGENVSVELLVRLDGLTKSRGCQFIAVTLATNGLIGDNARLPNVVTRAREKGVKVLDLSTEIAKLQADKSNDVFMPAGHYSPATNRWVAQRIVAFMKEKGI